MSTGISWVRDGNKKKERDIEIEADSTEPFMDTEMIREKIDLDSYADYIKTINSGKFWAEVAIRDRE